MCVKVPDDVCCIYVPLNFPRSQQSFYSMSDLGADSNVSPNLPPFSQTDLFHSGGFLISFTNITVSVSSSHSALISVCQV